MGAVLTELPGWQQWPWDGPCILTLHLSVLLLSLEWLRLSLGAFMCMFFIVGFQRST